MVVDLEANNYGAVVHDTRQPTLSALACQELNTETAVDLETNGCCSDVVHGTRRPRAERYNDRIKPSITVLLSVRQYNATDYA